MDALNDSDTPSVSNDENFGMQPDPHDTEHQHREGVVHAANNPLPEDARDESQNNSIVKELGDYRSYGAFKNSSSQEIPMTNMTDQRNKLTNRGPIAVRRYSHTNLTDNLQMKYHPVRPRLDSELEQNDKNNNKHKRVPCNQDIETYGPIM